MIFTATRLMSLTPGRVQMLITLPPGDDPTGVRNRDLLAKKDRDFDLLNALIE